MSTPDIVLMNVPGGTAEVKRSGVWEGVSDHAPILLEVPDTEVEGGRLRWTSKSALNNWDRKKMAIRAYARVFLTLIT